MLDRERNIGMMRTKTIISQGLITVMAENLVATGVSLQTEPGIKTSATSSPQCLPMFATPSVNMVNRQELNFGFPTTSTTIAIGSKSLLLQAFKGIKGMFAVSFRVSFYPSQSCQTRLLALFSSPALALLGILLASSLKILGIELRVCFNFFSSLLCPKAAVTTLTKPFSNMAFMGMTSSIFHIYILS